MDFFDNFFNIIKEDGKVLSSVNMELNKSLSHADALKIFINNYEDFKDYPSDFYERIDKFYKDGNVLFYNMTDYLSYKPEKTGLLYLPENMTNEQLEVLKNQNFNNAYMFVYKDGKQVETTMNFDAYNYKGKTK